jgi:hypothetical protein
VVPVESTTLRCIWASDATIIPQVSHVCVVIWPWVNVAIPEKSKNVIITMLAKNRFDVRILKIPWFLNLALSPFESLLLLQHNHNSLIDYVDFAFKPAFFTDFLDHVRKRLQVGQ